MAAIIPIEVVGVHQFQDGIADKVAVPTEPLSVCGDVI